MTSIPFRIAATYVLVGGLLIFVSDLVLGTFISSPKTLMYGAIAKGTLYVAVTGLLLSFLIRRGISQTLHSEVSPCSAEAIHEKLIKNDTAEDMEKLDLANNLYLLPQDREEFISTLKEKGSIRGLESSLKRKDGITVWISTNAQLVKDAEGEILGIEGVARDITDRKMAEDALRESEKQYRTLFESANEAIMLMEHGTIIDCNPKTLKMFGSAREQIIGKTPCDLSPPKQPDGQDSTTKFWSIVDLAQKKLPLSFEWRHCRADKTLFDAEVSLTAFELSGKRLIMALVRDITKRKSAEASLEQANEYLENIFENSPDAIGIVDAHGEFIKLNRVAVELFRYSFEDNAELTAFDFYADKNEREKILFELRRQGVVRGYEVMMQRTDGSILPVEISISLLKDNSGKNIGSVAIARDLSQIKKINEMLRKEISERLHAEEALSKSEDMYRTIFENTGTATIIVEEDTTIFLANAEYERLTGYSKEETQGRISWTHFASESDLPKMLEHHSQRRINPDVVPKKYEFELIDRHGNSKTVLATVGMIPGSKRSVASFIDTTDQKKLEERFFRADKLESVGILAGGIAHDFNNILGAVVGNISLAKMYAKDARIHERLEEAEKACMRAKDLTYQLLTFSKGGDPVKRATSIWEIIKESADFALRGSNVRCDFNVEENKWLIDGDAGQISQVINNIIINAKQAMPTGGAIRASLNNITLSGAYDLPLQPGKYIKISIQDHGTGIPKEHLPKVFDPYFTTKQSGSGLGLATSYSIISKHDGYIDVESELGVGTTFHIYLPASEKEPAATDRFQKNSLNGKGKVLLMDDEQIIRDVAAQMLAHLGYTAASTKDGLEAIKVFREAMEAGEPFDGVILDLTIPGGMGGVDAIGKLKEIDPSIKAIASSGYSNDPVMADFKKFGFTGVIAKPYRIDELAKVVAEAVGREE
jgi:PAS domain S-box-containing protein